MDETPAHHDSHRTTSHNPRHNFMRSDYPGAIHANVYGMHVHPRDAITATGHEISAWGTSPSLQQSVTREGRVSPRLMQVNTHDPSMHYNISENLPVTHEKSIGACNTHVDSGVTPCCTVSIGTPDSSPHTLHDSSKSTNTLTSPSLESPDAFTPDSPTSSFSAESLKLSRDDFLSVTHLSQQEAAALYSLSLSTFKRRLRAMKPNIKWPRTNARMKFMEHSRRIQEKCKEVVDENMNLLRTMEVEQSTDDKSLLDPQLPSTVENLRSIRKENERLMSHLHELLQLTEFMVAQSTKQRGMPPARFLGNIKNLPGPWNTTTDRNSLEDSGTQLESTPTCATGFSATKLSAKRSDNRDDNSQSSLPEYRRSKRKHATQSRRKSPPPQQTRGMYLTDVYCRVAACDEHFLGLTGFAWKDFEDACDQGGFTESRLYLQTPQMNDATLLHLLHTWYSSGVLNTSIPAMSLRTNDGKFLTVRHEVRMIRDNKNTMYAWHLLQDLEYADKRHGRSAATFGSVITMDGMEFSKLHVTKSSEDLDFSFEERSKEQSFLLIALYKAIQQCKSMVELQMMREIGGSGGSSGAFATTQQHTQHTRPPRCILELIGSPCGQYHTSNPG